MSDELAFMPAPELAACVRGREVPRWQVGPTTAGIDDLSLLES